MYTFKLRYSNVVIFCLCSLIIIVDADSEALDEPRGKKKKKQLALFLYFAELIVKKIFIFKLVYAFTFWLVLHKAGYFLRWFLTYLKEKKHEHVVYEHDHDHDYYPHHQIKDYSSYNSYGHGDSYSPYKRQAHGIVGSSGH